MQILTTFFSIIIVAILVSSCAKTGGKGAPKHIKAYSLQGCGVGAVTGGLLGLLSGSDNVLKGATLGCGVGTIIGFSIAKRTEKYVDASRAMDAEIARNQENTKNLNTYNTRLAQGIQSYQKQIQEIESATSDASQKKIRFEQIRSSTTQELQKAKTALKNVNTELVVAEKQYKIYTAKLAANSTVKSKAIIPKQRSNNDKKWQSEIVNLEKEKKILSKHVKSLSALSASI